MCFCLDLLYSVLMITLTSISMNIVLCSSRGKCLLPLNERPDTTVSVRGGGKYTSLTKEAVEHLERLQYHPGPKLVYLVAGLPDITQKLKHSFWMNGRYHDYEEVIFCESDTAESNSNRVINNIRSSAASIVSAGGIPVFSTVLSCDISAWNKTRLGQHKTSHLIYYNRYQPMQEKLLDSTKLINSFILHENSLNQAATPKLAQPIFYKRGSSWRFKPGKFTDGVHTESKVDDTLLKLFTKVLDRNINSFIPESDTYISDSDSDASCKRSWLY